MELHTKQLQIGMNRTVPWQQNPCPQNAGLLNLRTVVTQQNKRNHCIVAK